MNVSKAALAAVFLAGLAGSSWAQCGPSTSRPGSASPFELVGGRGQLRLCPTPAAGDGRPFVHRLSVSRTAVGPEAATDPGWTEVGASPARWGTRLSTPGLADVGLLEFDPSRMKGTLVAGAGRVLAGVVEMPGEPGAWSAFSARSSARQEVAALELLYASVLRADTVGRYRFTAFGDGASVSAPATYSQAELLLELGRRRNAMAAALPGMRIRPWRLVRVTATRPESPRSPDRVQALVADDDGPIRGASVVFSRAPHSGCRAVTDTSGRAACTLVDSHGDDGEHEDHAAVVATFGGVIDDARLSPPMSAVVEE